MPPNPIQRAGARLDRASGARRLRRRATPLDDDVRPDPSRPPGVDRVPQVRHIVLLMMENHSFDNYLGRLGRGDGFPDPLPVNDRSDGTPVAAHHLTGTGQTPGVPSQSWRSSHLQYDDGRNDGFATSIEDLTPGADASIGMGYWTGADLPFYYGLARTFPLADRWFSSLLGPTFPNRRFLIAATADGLIDDAITSVIAHPRTGTIFDLLDRYGISWANYHHVPPLRLLRSRVGVRWIRMAKLAVSGLIPAIDHEVRGEIRCTSNLYPLGINRTLGHLRRLDRFFAAAKAGTLPSVSVVDPDFATFSEENPQDIQIGESFAADVIDAVMHGPAWPHTLLIWLYDEHGGYYDHVPPPPAVLPDDVAPHSLAGRRGALTWLARGLNIVPKLRREDTASGTYNRYGFRVPAVVVSPRGRPDFVSSRVYDHTSALKLIEEKWNLPSLTRRDAEATAPWDLLDLDGPAAFLTPPRLPAPARPQAWRAS